jgi:hypothetical protein
MVDWQAEVITPAQKNGGGVAIVKVESEARCSEFLNSERWHNSKTAPLRCESLIAKCSRQLPWRVKTMSTNAAQLKGLVIRATDDEIGTADQEAGR